MAQDKDSAVLLYSDYPVRVHSERAMSVEKVQTQYGEVEIETVECDSCGNTIAKDEAKEFTIGVRDGYACSHCESEGPIEFPDYERWKFELPDTDDGGISWGGLFIFAWIIMPLLMVIAPFDSNAPEGAKKMAVYLLCHTFWLCVGFYALVRFGVV